MEFNLDLTSTLFGAGLVILIQHIIDPISEKIYLKTNLDNIYLNYIILGRKKR